MMGNFLGFMEEGLNLFDPKITLRYAQDNLEMKRGQSPWKIPQKMPHYTFRISSTLIDIKGVWLKIHY